MSLLVLIITIKTASMATLALAQYAGIDSTRFLAIHGSILIALWSTLSSSAIAHGATRANARVFFMGLDSRLPKRWDRALLLVRPLTAVVALYLGVTLVGALAFPSTVGAWCPAWIVAATGIGLGIAAARLALARAVGRNDTRSRLVLVSLALLVAASPDLIVAGGTVAPRFGAVAIGGDSWVALAVPFAAPLLGILEAAAVLASRAIAERLPARVGGPPRPMITLFVRHFGFGYWVALAAILLLAAGLEVRSTTLVPATIALGVLRYALFADGTVRGLREIVGARRASSELRRRVVVLGIVDALAHGAMAVTAITLVH